MMAQPQQQAPDHYAYSMAEGDGRNRAAQAGNTAAHAAEKQKKAKKVDQEDLARIVAEENESKGRLPRYPGLERWQLIEKMGDGAFSNVYKARDLEGQAGEVAIKVVRKFEMNSSQVSIGTTESSFLAVCPLILLGRLANTRCREMPTCIRTLQRSNRRSWRCALLFFFSWALIALSGSLMYGC